MTFRTTLPGFYETFPDEASGWLVAAADALASSGKRVWNSKSVLGNVTVVLHSEDNLVRSCVRPGHRRSEVHNCKQTCGVLSDFDLV
jgi:hypothetical protein